MSRLRVSITINRRFDEVLDNLPRFEHTMLPDQGAYLFEVVDSRRTRVTFTSRHRLLPTYFPGDSQPDLMDAQMESLSQLKSLLEAVG